LRLDERLSAIGSSFFKKIKVQRKSGGKSGKKEVGAGLF
jgi:hypothetical protein